MVKGLVLEKVEEWRNVLDWDGFFEVGFKFVAPVDRKITLKRQ